LLKKSIILIDRYHWLWLVLAAPFMVFPSPERSVAQLVIPLLWLFYLWQGKKYKIENIKYKIGNVDEDRADSVIKPGFPVTSLNLGLLILVLMLLVSLWATYSMEQSLEKISGLVLGLGVLFAVVRESNKPSGWWRSFALFLGGGLAWALLGFFGMEYEVRFSLLAPVITRIPILISSFPTLGTGLQHNAVGGTLVWVLPSLMGLSVYLVKYKIEEIKLNIENWGLGKRWFESRCGGVLVWVMRLGVWLGTILMTGVLILTQSRGSYLAIALTALIVFMIILSKEWRWILAGLLVISAIGVIVFIQTSEGWEMLVTNLGLSGEAELSTDTLGFRLEIWSRAIAGLQEFSFTGMGMNTFREVVPVLYPLFTISPEIDIAHAHNEFLQVVLDLGTPGLIAFISIYISSFWMLFKIWRASPVDPGAGLELPKLSDPILKQTLVLGLGGGLFAHLVFGMLDAITLGAKPGIFFWMLLGLITGMYLGIKNWKIEK